MSENEKSQSQPKKRKPLEFYQLVERSINKTYAKTIRNPFVEALKKYELIKPNDKIAVCVSGGKDSWLLAVLMRMLHRYTEIPFKVEYICMNPGYNEENLNQILYNSKLLNLPLHIFETNVFRVANRTENNPCYLCARMRRGNLYKEAQNLGCNKIALGHHFDDVIETTLMGMLYGAQIQAMMPKLHSKNFEGMELIRPLYCIHEDAIINWRNYNNLKFIQCACKFTEAIEKQNINEVHFSKRQETKQLIANLKKINPNVDKNIFNSIHTADVDTLVSYKLDGVKHNFLECYDQKGCLNCIDDNE